MIGIGNSLSCGVVAASLGPPAPVAVFTVAVIDEGRGLQIRFTEASTGTPTDWLWECKTDFGGSWEPIPMGQSTSQLPNDISVDDWNTALSGPGGYLVRLTATNAGGSNTAASQTIYTTGA